MEGHKGIWRDGKGREGKGREQKGDRGQGGFDLDICPGPRSSLLRRTMYTRESRGASERFRECGYKFVRTLYNLVVKVVCLKL